MRKSALFVVIGMALLGTACGSKEDPAPAASPAAAPAPEAAPASTAPKAAEAPVVDCYPITTTVPFQIRGALVNLTQLDKRVYQVIAGKFPQDNQSFGSIAMGGQPAGGVLTRESPDGKISFGLSMDQPQNPIPNGLLNTQSNGQGVLEISQVAQNDMISKIHQGQIQIQGLSGTGALNNFSGGAGTPPAANQICVSGVAINGGTIQTGPVNTFYGDVYLYLNHSNSGYVMKF